MGWDKHKSFQDGPFRILHNKLLRIENRNEFSEKLQNPILITIFDKKEERRILDCFFQHLNHFKVSLRVLANIWTLSRHQ